MLPEIVLNQWSYSREVIDCSGWKYVPNPDWYFIDKQGICHRWYRDESHEWVLPSLVYRTVSVPAACPECGRITGETEEIGEWYVPTTGEVVKPGYIKENIDRKMAGLLTLTGSGPLKGKDEVRVRVGDPILIVHPTRVKGMVTGLRWDSFVNTGVCEVISTEELEEGHGTSDRIGQECAGGGAAPGADSVLKKH